MGMSADFETAIAFGATHVRVGSQIFGTARHLSSRPERVMRSVPSASQTALEPGPSCAREFRQPTARTAFCHRRPRRPLACPNGGC